MREWAVRFRGEWLAAALALLAYAVTLGGTFVYDDVAQIVEDSRLTPRVRWAAFLTERYNDSVDNLYRPLTSLTYAGQVALQGTATAWPFHALNILLHAIASALVATFGRRLTGSAAVGLIAGAFFALHPVHVEAVAYVVGRAETLATIGFVAGLVLMLRGPLTPVRAVGITACGVFSLLSKEQGLLLPLALLLIGWCVPRVWSAQRPGRQTLLLLLCFGWAGYIVFREYAFDHRFKFWWDRSFLDWSIQPTVRSEGMDRLLMPFVLLGRYACLIVWPTRLSPDYGGYVIGYQVSVTDPYLWIGVATAIFWATLLARSFARRDGVLFFLLAALAVTYSVIANAFTLIGTNFGERLIYLPSVFVCVGAAVLIVRHVRSRKVTEAVVGLICVLMAVRTVTYAARWNDRLSFYQTSLAGQPKSTRLALLLAYEQRKLGDLSAARTTMDEAREATPDYWGVWLFSAIIALDHNDKALARDYLAKARALRPQIPVSAWEAELGPSTRPAG